MTELRYFTRKQPYGCDETVLQYRERIEVTDYSATDSNGSFIKTTGFTKWKDIPEQRERYVKK